MNEIQFLFTICFHPIYHFKHSRRAAVEEDNALVVSSCFVLQKLYPLNSCILLRMRIPHECHFTSIYLDFAASNEQRRFKHFKVLPSRISDEQSFSMRDDAGFCHPHPERMRISAESDCREIFHLISYSGKIICHFQPSQVAKHEIMYANARRHFQTHPSRIAAVSRVGIPAGTSARRGDLKVNLARPGHTRRRHEHPHWSAIKYNSK